MDGDSDIVRTCCCNEEFERVAAMRSMLENRILPNSRPARQKSSCRMKRAEHYTKWWIV